jgi:thioredoxin-like negative regulator of GroEL
MNRSAPILCAALAAATLAACSKREAPPAAPPASAASTAQAAPADGGIAWVRAATDAEVDAAFARARSEGKPVFVYWGAKWCPPCNQLQATLFNRQDFIERSRAFVPVYVDGDKPGAQKLGSRFAVRGYPTTVVFDRSGQELTRLPGEVDAQQYNEVLTLSMSAQRSAKAVLAQARAGGQGLAEADWRLLAYYSWETDQQQLAGAAGVAPLLKELAQACPAAFADSAMRLRLKALAAADGKAGPVADAAAQRAPVLALLADAAQSRRHMDVLTNSAAELASALGAAGSGERKTLLAAFDGALLRLQADASLSRADRLMALVARVQLAQLEATGKDKTAATPQALRTEVRDIAARFDREITDGYERQAVITTAAWALEQAGLLDESDVLLKANLARSHSPYYLMADLADNAKKRGDKAGALDWNAQAFDRSEGPATRLQWGARYLGALVELAPQDGERIERVAAQLFGEAAALPDAFEARSGRSLQRIGGHLSAWAKGGAHGDAMKRLQRQLDAVCAKLPAGDSRTLCDGVLKPGSSA